MHGDISNREFTVTTDFAYEYPEGLNLRPDSELHRKLKTLILEYANASNKAISNRYDSWNKIDETLTAYIEVDESEQEVIAKDPRKPTSIVFPYSYAMLETLVTYLFVAFVQEPIFRYEGYTSEDTVGAILLESVINMHCNKSKVGLNLHTFFRDCLAYGLGVCSLDWVVKRGYKTVKKDIGLGENRYIKTREPAVLFEGNALHNVDPYRYLPDPNFPIQEQQKAGFQGWVTTDNVHDLLRSELDTPEELFNIKYVKQLEDRRSQYGTDNSNRSIRTGLSRDTTINDSRTAVDILYCQVDLVPKEYKLSTSEVPERWEFGLAADKIIISAKPTKFNHGMFPLVVGAPDFDGYTTTPIGRLEIMYGLQHVLDFLFNSHIANVRKAVNDMWIVDPQAVNIHDINNPKAGKIIRLRRPQWGRGVKDVLAQFPVNDITRANVADSTYIVEWMERVIGADASMSGSLRKGGPERLTKSEFQGTRQGSVSRLERLARVLGMQGLQDIGYMFASHTQQMMDEETYAMITGRLTEDTLREYGIDPSQAKALVKGGRMKISPYNLLINYDVIVRDGSIPGGNFNEAELTLFNNIVQADPEVRANFDIVRIFEHLAKRMGWKNVEDFKRNVNNIQPKILPDETVNREAEKGNLIPVGV